MVSQEKLKMGIDIDEIVVEFFRGYLNFFNKKFGSELKFEDVTKFHIWKVIDISKEKALEVAQEFYSSKFFDELSFVEGALESVKRLQKDFEIHFITSRPENIRDHTRKFLEKYFGEDFYLHFSGGVWKDNFSKGEICESFGIDLFIEDNFEYALDCAKRGVKTFVFRKPWNKHFSSKGNVIFVEGWKDFFDKLNSVLIDVA